MENIHAQSVSDALGTALIKFAQHGVPEDSRNGPVLVMPTPVMTTYYKPWQRVLFSRERNANPFFHLFEAVWMILGRYDVWALDRFNKRMASYSDDGESFWGAYGWRWRSFFGYDQLSVIINELKNNPNSRRAVLAMWNAADEIDSGGRRYAENEMDSTFASDADLLVARANGKDVPCNTHAYFDCRCGVLNMTVCNRSNDAWWGAYGANAVHFSVLLEYMATRIGVPMGVYRQMSNNLHLYTDVVSTDNLPELANIIYGSDLYQREEVPVMPIFDVDDDLWRYEARRVLIGDGVMNEHITLQSQFIGTVLVPLWRAWDAYKNRDHEAALVHVRSVNPAAQDWKIAAFTWLQWREQERAARVRKIEQENRNG